MKEFLDVILGDTPVGEFLGYLFLALIGSTLYLAVRIRNRHKSDNGKPSKWNFWFLMKDEWDRLFITLILVYIWASYGHQINAWIQQYVQTGDMGKGAYIAIGFFTDMIVVYLKKGYLWVGKKVKAIFKNIQNS
jgi:hypothetical protein